MANSALETLALLGLVHPDSSLLISKDSLPCGSPDILEACEQAEGFLQAVNY